MAYQRSGSGAPPGARSWYRRLFYTLETHSSSIGEVLYGLRRDRRGRGESGDGSNYAIEREFDDVAAVVDPIGNGVDLLGHSFGAVCALEAGLRTSHLRTLILYEPPLALVGLSIYPEGIVDRLRAQLDSGDRRGVLTTFFHEVVRMPAHEFELFQ